MKLFYRSETFSNTARWRVATGICLASVAALANFGLLFVSGWLLAAAACAGLGGVAAQRSFNMVLPATGVRFFATVRIVARYVERLITHDAALRIIGQTRVWFYTTIAPHAPAALTTNRSGDLLSSFVTDTDRVGQYYTDTVVPYARAALCCVIFLIIFSIFSIKITFSIAIFFIVCGIIVPYCTGLISDRLLFKVKNIESSLQADLSDTFSCLGEYIALGAAKRQQAYMAQYQHKLIALHFTLAATENGAKAIIGLITTAATLITLYFATQAFTQHLLTLPEVPMLVLGCLAAFDVVTPLPSARQNLGAARLAIMRLEKVCLAPNCTENKQAPSIIPNSTLLDLQDISFKYQSTNEWIFSHANLQIHAGERVALVGPSGSGKSSLINLLFGFYRQQKGHIYFGGMSLNTVTPEILSGDIAVAGQDFHLFNGTLRDNLLLANTNATEQELWSTLDIVQLKEFVMSTPQGLESLVGNEGLCLSGGQAKRLSIAQALLRNTPWLILDEPTEGLDAQTEQVLLKNLVRFRPNATLVCLTHRQAVLPYMTRVLQIKEGTFSPMQEEKP